MKIVKRVINKIRSIHRERNERLAFEKNMKIVQELAKNSGSSDFVIVDCGFNQGVVAANMLNALPRFSLIGFEVQQDIQEFAEVVKNKFPDRSVSVIYSGASTFDGELKYYEPRSWGKNYKGGTTTLESKSQLNDNYLEPKLAPAMDFAKWLSENIKSGTFVFVKMDIEGAEYDVIEHLLKTGAIDFISVIAVEWHAHKFAEPLRSQYIVIENKLRAYSSSNRIRVLDWY
jgi:FkbM family methyltransferase